MSLFESMLTGGHPNSLGRTLEVVDIVLADPPQLEQLYQMTMETLTFWSKDNMALRGWLKPHLERLTHDSRKSVANRAVKFSKVLAEQAE